MAELMQENGSEQQQCRCQTERPTHQRGDGRGHLKRIAALEQNREDGQRKQPAGLNPQRNTSKGQNGPAFSHHHSRV